MNSSGIWAAASLLAAVGFGILAMWIVLHTLMPAPRQPATPEEADAGPSYLELRARWGTALSLFLLVAYLLVLLAFGPQGSMENAWIRVPVSLGFVLGLLVYLGLMAQTIRRVRSGRMLIDERDLQILARAPAAQVVAILVSLAAWSILLTEIYKDQGSLPLAIPTVLLWSSILISMLGFSVGVLLGSRWS